MMPSLIRTFIRAFILLNIVNSAVAGFLSTCNTQESTITKHEDTIALMKEKLQEKDEKLKEKDVEIAKVRTLMASSCKDMLLQIGVAAKALGNAVDSHTCKTESSSCQMQLEALRSSCCDKLDNNGKVIETFTTSCVKNCDRYLDGSWVYPVDPDLRNMHFCGERSCAPGSRLHGRWEIYNMKKMALWKADGVCYTNPAS
jgi:hypothetical protein